VRSRSRGPRAGCWRIWVGQDYGRPCALGTPRRGASDPRALSASTASPAVSEAIELARSGLRRFPMCPIDPSAARNPTLRIGAHLREPHVSEGGKRNTQREDRLCPPGGYCWTQPREMHDAFPHQLSGLRWVGRRWPLGQKGGKGSLGWCVRVGALWGLGGPGGGGGGPAAVSASLGRLLVPALRSSSSTSLTTGHRRLYPASVTRAVADSLPSYDCCSCPM